MRHVPFRPLPLRDITLFLLLTILLVACSSSVTPQPQPTPPPAIPFACNQPMPTPVPGKITLAGLGYGPYHAGQDPNYGISPSSGEVAADMPTLSTLTNYIRIYSSTGPAEAILQAAEASHLCVSLGIWLGKDARANAAEIAAGERLAKQSKAVRSVIVGNEVLLRGDLSEDQLRLAIQDVRSHLGRTVALSVADDFNQWLQHPKLAQDVDFLTVHIYPFWRNIPINAAIQDLNDTYMKVKNQFRTKPIVIGETGWPSATDNPQGSGSLSPTPSPTQGAAMPSPANQASYFEGFTTWAQQHGVPYFYFDAFDEDWKTNEQGVGTHWGLYEQSGALKPALSKWLPPAAPRTVQERSYRDVYLGSKLEKPFDLGIDTNKQQRTWLTAADGALTLAYPAGQLWGAMFITVGQPVPPGNRPSIDLSRYRSFSVELRAATNGQRVRLGIKDRTQPDDGSEITIEETLTTDWSAVSLPLPLFANVDQKHLYVVFEIVFLGSAGATLEMRNLRYAPTQVVAPRFPPVKLPFTVYTDLGDPNNHYVPSGGMGDYGVVTVTQDWTENPHQGTTCIQVVYGGPKLGGVGWAGFYWQDPVNNWGTVPGPTGYDLSGASHLSFWVRGKTGGERIQFLTGGITGRHGDSLQPAVKTVVMTLTTQWQQVTIDVTGKDLTHLIGGFAWVANIADNSNGATFYLDDIVYLA